MTRAQCSAGGKSVDFSKKFCVNIGNAGCPISEDKSGVNFCVCENVGDKISEDFKSCISDCPTSYVVNTDAYTSNNKICL